MSDVLELANRELSGLNKLTRSTAARLIAECSRLEQESIAYRDGGRGCADVLGDTKQERDRLRALNEQLLAALNVSRPAVAAAVRFTEWRQDSPTALAEHMKEGLPHLRDAVKAIEAAILAAAATPPASREDV
jgi:hypothetical protein